jgi:tRNA pseudouridine32 synthase/23S rRNA pseudouridine746 synthase
VVTPSGTWHTVHDFLAQRFATVSAQEWQLRMLQGDVTDTGGQPLAPQTPFQPGLRLYYYRALPHEEAIPFEAVLLHHDAHLLVVDKPHFLPVLPSGKYLHETVLVRLKDRLNMPDLSPIHRIDRDTAGLVLFSVNPVTRDAYHALFRKRAVHKTYHAVAPWNPALPWPLRRESRIGPAQHFMQQQELPGTPNAVTTITPLEQRGALALYQLEPHTGQRHQLRVHMAALGLPILNDGIYPTLTPEGPPDYSRPLQLVAHALAFTDPICGQHRTFTSRHKLQLP